MNWFIYALKNSFNFKDRARRREYGWFILINFLIQLALGIIQEASKYLNLEGISLVLSTIFGLFTLILFIANISVTTRRLHDLGYSGWWQLSPFLLGLIISLIILFANFEGSGDSSGLIIFGIFYFIMIAVYLIFSLWLIFKDGQPHTNKYGKSPKYDSDTPDETSPPTQLVA
ncbi:hypothetical protein RO21_07870 [[Actinobacillus] muris]|uniref:DUF805 domain-containing protein n=1 Tax=Muribacter muris TaxID=67855 RepID=A0A0J5P5R9_9PAST|nr:DUF805 domain-containing protein [Muribacter muris]KMK51115.1 hypothetical protein RO21_07870 [[Actinobacillus] muris] [Muribacter muris]